MGSRWSNTARRPDFLGIGAQKAGTTTLHELLRHHPDVFVPDLKETHFFSRHFDQSQEWYDDHFRTALSTQTVGEVTPYYLFHPAAPARIAAALPGARLFVLLRDPVDRALSGYFHAKRLGMEPLPIDEAFEVEAERLRDADLTLEAPGARHVGHEWHSYAARSQYHVQLARYRSLFPADRILIVRSEDFFNTPGPVWVRIQSFLGVRAIELPARFPHANGGGGERAAVSPRLRQRLRTQLEPVYQVLHRDYGIAWPTSMVPAAEDAT